MARPIETAPRMTLFLFAAATVVLAGCVSSSGADTAAPAAGAAPAGSDVSAAPAEFTEETGAVSGTVTTSDLQPIANAEVGMDGSHWTALSAADGSFSFSKIPPGDYIVEAGQLGYDVAQRAVRVEAGRVTNGVSIALEPIPVSEAYAQTYLFNGFITCSVGYALVLSEECGQGLQTPVGTFGTDPNNHIDWRFNLTTVENLDSLYLELTWRPGSAAAQQLAFNVAHGFTCTPDCGATTGPTYCGAFENFGRPVQKCRITVDDLQISSASKMPWDITGRAWAAPSPQTDMPNIVLQQAFTMFRTEFYGDAMPNGFSAVSDS
jgi:hypothetical protein